MKDYITGKRGLRTAAWLTLLGGWFVLSLVVDNQVIVPGIGATLLRLFEIVQAQDFFMIVGFTILRCLAGFAVSLLIAVILGGLSRSSAYARALMEPVLGFLSSVPIMAIIILALIWLDSQLVPVFVGFVMVFPILYEAVYNSIVNVDGKLIQMAQVFGVDGKSMIKDIYLPSILAGIGRVSTSTLGTSLKMVIAGEVLAQPKFAIGTRLQLEKTYLNTDGVFAWIVVILLISWVLKFVMERIKTFSGNEGWM
jgi:NitT/TauT family transport system permease protein